MINKSILKSKTFWVQVIALASVLFPPVQDWLARNPVEFVAALAAVNVVVRFVTSGKVSLSGEAGVPCWLCVGTAAGLLLFLPSCSAAPPLGIVLQGPGYSAGYSAKDGLMLHATLPPRALAD